MSSTFASMRYYNYRLWWGANIFGSSGAWMQRVAQDWLVLQQLTDHSAFAVGITTSLQFLPQLLFSIPAGMIADRFDKKRTIQIMQAVIGCCGAILGALVITGTAELWHVYLLAFIGGAADSIISPSRLAFITSLVPPAELPNAVALNSMAFNGGRLIGPGLAGFMIAAVGTGWVFVLNAALFLVPMGMLFLIRQELIFERQHSHRGQSGLRMIREGFAYVRKRTDIVAIMLVATVLGSLGMNFQLTQAVMATQVFGRGSEEYGILGSVMAFGSLLGALAIARVRHPRVLVVLVSALSFALLEGACALAPTYEAFALLLVPTGFFGLMFMSSANAAIQVSTDEKLRGRVLSIYLLFFVGSAPVGSFVIGWVAEYLGPRWSLGIGALSTFTVACAVSLWTWRNWNVDFKVDTSRPFLHIDGPRERAQRAKVEYQIEETLEK